MHVAGNQCQTTRATDGKWVEQTPLTVGLVKDFSTEKKARAEAVAKGLIERINQSQQITRNRAEVEW
jgi:hypothetical protein